MTNRELMSSIVHQVSTWGPPLALTSCQQDPLGPCAGVSVTQTQVPGNALRIQECSGPGSAPR